MIEHRVASHADAYAALCEPGLRQSLYDAGAVIMDSVLLTLHGQAHKARRQLELRVFRRELLREYEQDVFPTTLAATLQPYVARGRADLVDFGYRVTMNLTADFAGIDRPQQSERETADLLALVRCFSEGATLVHSTRDPAIVRAEVQAALERFVAQFLAPSIARRRKLLATSTSQPRDVLSILLANEDRIDLPEDVLTREIGFYLQAGAHSTANAMVHAVHEVLEWSRKVPTQAARLRDDPGFLQRCIHESLRLHPASPVAWRTPVDAVELRDGRRLAPGDRLIIDIASANRDVSVFGADADEFNPERTVVGPRSQLYGLTFGTGVHLCPGRDLDGGIPVDQGPAVPMRGIVTLLVQALLDQNVRRDPTAPARSDSTTARNHWATYPVLLGTAA
jgi:cytochrome P450